MGEADFAETSVRLYQIVRRHIPANHNFLQLTNTLVGIGGLYCDHVGHHPHVDPPHVGHPHHFFLLIFLFSSDIHPFISLQSYIHHVHTNVAQYSNVIIFAVDKRFGIDDSRHWVLEGSKTVGKYWEASSVVIPAIRRTISLTSI
jgi:hypothetical protein